MTYKERRDDALETFRVETDNFTYVDEQDVGEYMADWSRADLLKELEPMADALAYVLQYDLNSPERDRMKKALEIYKRIESEGK